MRRWLIIGVLIAAGLMVACSAPWEDEAETLRLATTTSTDDSGLLDAILPDFEAQYDATVDVIAVGTGQALELGERGDVDVVLVHARKLEDQFVAAGYGINRQDVMANDFIIVGPAADPAGIASTDSASEAFKMIAGAEAPFASRGDESGTNVRELALWEAASLSPESGGWYSALGQGMGETLITADEMGAYTLTDRATFLSMQDDLPNLTVLLGGESIAENPDLDELANPYGVIQVNPERHDGIDADLAAAFVEWLISPETQAAIGEFGHDEFGQFLFKPAHPTE